MAPRRILAADVSATLTWLERHGSRRNRDGLTRYGIVAPRAFGVSMASLERVALRLRPNHELALALWDTGWYEARMLATLIDDPASVTARQMEQWCRDFDNWAICDTACFKLFDRTPLAWTKIRPWSRRRAEFERRAAFALIASLALHDRVAADAKFRAILPIVEKTARDERNFVKKGVSWALRAIGRRNAALRQAATAVAQSLATSSDSTARSIGKEALRDFARQPARKNR